jgi:hypothetical protein
MIVRSPRPESNFYLLDKRISEDKRLSWAARGLLIYILGKPDNWRVSAAALANEVAGTDKPTGRDATYALLGELIKSGYVLREQGRDNDGKVSYVNYIVFEEPAPLQSKPDTAKPHTDQPDTAQPHTAKPTLTSIESKTRTEEEARIEGETRIESNKRARSTARTSKPSAAIACPDDVDEQVFGDWLEVRKAKRAGPVTQTVLDSMRREADKAGINLQDAIVHCCLAGWQGFRADWYTSAKQTGGQQAQGQRTFFNRQIALEEENRRVGQEWLEKFKQQGEGT